MAMINKNNFKTLTGKWIYLNPLHQKLMVNRNRFKNLDSPIHGFTTSSKNLATNIANGECRTSDDCNGLDLLATFS